MEILIKQQAMFYAKSLEDEIYHIFNLLKVSNKENAIPAEIRERILRSTKSNINHLNIILQS